MLRGDVIPDEDLAEINEDLRACTMLDGLLESLRATGPTRELAIAADCPVRIAWAAKDRTIPYKRYGAPWRAILPEAEFLHMPGIGHVPMYDDPALVIRTICEFTARVDNPSATAS